MDADTCDKCNGVDICTSPMLIDHDDGSIEEDHDTLHTKCNECGHTWIIVYI